MDMLLPREAALTHGARHFDKLCGLSFEDTQSAVQEMCEKFSSANKYGGGRGDDCSIVYIKPKR